MEVERALADLQEVRDRLASLQRYRGYSGQAAAVSGVFAVVAGLIQLAVSPSPRTAADVTTYLLIWFGCLAAALAVNYGAGLLWYARNAERHARSQTRNAGLTILPAVVLGAVLSLALIIRNEAGLLPGVWYACYAIGLFAARAMLPRGVLNISILFGAIGTALLLAPDQNFPLQWWIMPLGFGAGQIVIGRLIAVDERDDAAEDGTWPSA